MDAFLVRLKPRSPYLTPWRNSTIWGRLTWLVADGRLPGWNVQDWIEAYRQGTPPLILGDAFPSSAVPVPAGLLAKARGSQKKPKTVPWTAWRELCASGVWPAKAPTPSSPRAERTHVVITREGGNASDGGLRTEQGMQPEELILLTKADPFLGEEGLAALLRALCQDGWGQGRTYGYGHVELQGIERVEPPAPTGAVATLGHCHPTEGLPQRGYWRWAGVPVRPHDLETRRAPSQFFTAMLLPGASFATDAPMIGRAVSLKERSDYLHYGLAPTWPIMEETL